MAVSDHLTELGAQIGRTRARSASSQQSIARAQERIRESQQVILQVMGKTAWLATKLPDEPLSDEQLSAVVDDGEAREQQRKIDREIAQTLRASGTWPSPRKR